MRVFAVSDLHVDFPDNARWAQELSSSDYLDDVLILAGDVSDSLSRLGDCLEALARRFFRVLFVPGNHDLWVLRDPPGTTSLDKFGQVRRVVRESGVSMETFRRGALTIVPLLGWYDYSFGAPTPQLGRIWMDYIACRWPDAWAPDAVAAHFLAMNPASIDHGGAATVISFSHFLPRIDVMPWQIPPSKRTLYPVLGSTALDVQARALGTRLHVYGHSHVNRRVELDGVKYVNSAYGYPHESLFAHRRMVCIDDV